MGISLKRRRGPVLVSGDTGHAMSATNVEIVRELTRTAGADLSQWLDFMAPEIELHLSGVFPDLDPVYRGHDGVREFVARFNATWEELTPDAYRFVDLANRVLALIHFPRRGRRR